MSVKNHYDILGINKDAAKKEIEDAYKKLARKFHPDTNNHDVFFLELFKSINEAKQVLVNDETRMEYDLELLNYSEAYNVLEQRTEEDDLNKKRRSRKYNRSGSRRNSNKLMIASGLVGFAIIAFLIMTASAPNGRQKETGKNTDQLNIEIMKDSMAAPMSSIGKPDIKDKPEEDKLSDHSTKESSDVGREKKNEVKSVGKNLSFKQMAGILNSIMIEKDRMNNKTNCVRILKTNDSNVSLGFDIADFLQSKGFIISGRSIIKSEQKGVKVDASGSCIKLIIGRM